VRGHPAADRTRAALGLGLLSGALTTAGVALEAIAEGHSGSELAVDPAVALGLLALPAVAALLAALRPNSPIGWLLLASALLFGLAVIVSGWADLGLRSSHGPLPGDDVAAALVAPLGGASLAITVTLVTLVFPDGRLPGPRWRWVAWLAVAGISTLALALVVKPGPVVEKRFSFVDNPLGIEAVGPALTALAVAGYIATVAAALAAFASLVLRLRRAQGEERGQIKWLVYACALVAVTAAGLKLVGGGAAENLHVASIGLIPVAVGIAVLRHRLLDIDLLIRRSVVYGALWLSIAAAYTGLAALLGIAAGSRLPVALVVLLTAAVTLVFQPARRRLETLADRWVFGERPSEATLLRDLRAAEPGLAERLAGGVARGLDLRWARVLVAGDSALAGDPQPGERPHLALPIGEGLGVIECGPRREGSIGPGDRELLESLAEQAALAAELTASRTRLVSAQDAERRRIERDIHDGAQQQVVALLATLGLARHRLGEDEALEQLDTQARQLLSDLRDLAQGIHPRLLIDHGLVAAVASMARQAPIPVAVEHDHALDDVRFSGELEAAAYFVVSEGLANVLKHAQARSARVRLGLESGALLVEVLDDGRGLADPAGSGLRGLRDRVEAVGGRLELESPAGGGTRLRARLPDA